MNDIISIEGDYYSYTGTVQINNDSNGKAYQIKLKRETLDEEIIEKQGLMITKLKNDNSILKGYLSKAVIELKQLKKEKEKSQQIPGQSSDLNDYYNNLQVQNSELKKELQQIQSELARYKDTAQQQRDYLKEEIIKLKRQNQETIQNQETLHYINLRKQHEIKEKEKEIWQLQNNISELIESNHQKQAFIDKFKIRQDQKAIRENFRYLDSSIHNKRENSNDILIEGEDFITTSHYVPIERFDYGVQTEIRDLLTSRLIERNNTSNRKNRHMSPEIENNHEEKIRQYARQLTQKEKQCADQQKAIDFIRKENKKMVEKIKEKEKQVKKQHKKYKKLIKKHGIHTKISSSEGSSEDLNADVYPSMRHSKMDVFEKLSIPHNIEIQTQESRIQNPNLQKKSASQKTNQRQSGITSLNQQASKKEKRRKNRTIQNDEQDGRQKLKSLNEDLEKKDLHILHLESEIAHNREYLNQARTKLRKKENQCKRMSKELKTFKNQLSQKDNDLDNGQSIAQETCNKTYCNESIQTEQIREAGPYHRKGKHRRTLSEVNLYRDYETPSNAFSKYQIIELQQNNADTTQQVVKDKEQSPQESLNEIRRPYQEQLLIPFLNRPSQEFITPVHQAMHFTPRSQSYSHNSGGQRIIDVQKLQKQNQLLKKQNTNLKYQLEDIKRNWLEGLKNIQREYCSESGSDLPSEKDIIGALSDREMLPRKIRERVEEENQNPQQKLQLKSVQTQTQQIQQGNKHEEDQNERELPNIKAFEDQSPKSYIKSIQLQDSHSQSSENDENHIEILSISQPQSKKKQIKHNLTFSQQNLRLKEKENNELRSKINELQKALVETKRKEEQLIQQIEEKNSHNVLVKQEIVEIKEQSLSENPSSQQKLVQNEAESKEMSLSGHIMKQIKVNLKLIQKSEFQIDDHDMEISQIQQKPQKNNHTILRQQHLFQLGHPPTLDIDSQTQSQELSLGESFVTDINKDQLSMIDAFKKVESRLQIVEIMPDQCRSMDQSQNLHINQELNLKIYKLQERIQELCEQLEKERNKKDSLKQEEYKNSLLNVDEKQISKYPSSIYGSEMIESKIQKQHLSVEIQTQEIENPLVNVKEQQTDQKTKQKLSESPHPVLKKSVSQQNEQVENTNECVQTKHHLVTFQQSVVNVSHPDYLDQSHQDHQVISKSGPQNTEKKIEHFIYKPINAKDNENPFFVQFRITESQVIKNDDDKQRLTPKKSALKHVKPIEQSIVDIYVEPDFMASKSLNNSNAYIATSECLEEKVFNVPRDSLNFAKSEMEKEKSPEKITKSPTKKAQSLIENQRATLMSLQLTQQINMYKQELLVTQQKNFRLEQQIYESNVKVKQLNKEIKAFQKNLSRKDQEIKQKHKQLEESNSVLAKLQQKNGKLVNSLENQDNERMEIVSFDRNQLPQRIQRSDKKMLSLIPQSLNIEDEDAIELLTKDQEKLTKFQQTQEFQEQKTLQKKQENQKSQKKQTHKLLQTQQKARKPSVEKQINQSKTPTNLDIDGQTLSRQIQTQPHVLQISETLISPTTSGFAKKVFEQLAEEEPLSIFGGSSQDQNRLIQSYIRLNSQRKELLISQMIIHETQSEILKCKQCLVYSSQVKRLQQHISKLNFEIDDLYVEMKKKQEMQEMELRQDQWSDGNIVFIEQIQVIPEEEDTQNHLSQIKHTQVVIRESDKEEILAVSLSQTQQQQQLQELQAQDIEAIFTIQNLDNLPYIYFDFYQGNHEMYVMHQGVNLNSSRHSSIRGSRRSDRKHDDFVINQAKKELEELYEPMLVMGADRIMEGQNLKGQNIPKRETSEQQCQTQNSHLAQTKNQSIICSQVGYNQTNHRIQSEVPSFPLLFVSGQPNSQQETYPLQKDLFRPLFNKSPFTSVHNQTIIHSQTYSQINQMLLQNFILDSKGQNAEKSIIKQLSLLVLKVLEEISNIKNISDTHSNQSPLQKSNKQVQQDDFLLEEDNLNDYRLKKSKISEPKLSNSHQLVQKIVQTLGPQFLYLQNPYPTLSQENFLNIALQIESKYLQY